MQTGSEPSRARPSTSPSSGTVEGRDASRGLYATLLGPLWLQLAEPVRLGHANGRCVRARGGLRIEHGSNPVARILAILLRLPLPSDRAESELFVTPRGQREHWRRTFASRRLDTWQSPSGDGGLAERLGVLEFRFHLEPSAGSLIFRQLGAAFLLGSIRMPIPAMWGPRIEAREDPAGAHRTRIRVRITLPGIGTLLTYDGAIDFEDTPA